jgi:Carboxypeptidase regulatory-like domain
MKSCKTLMFVAIVSMVCALAAPALAQITTATLAGTVKDSQGGAVPGATVTLVSDARGTSQDTQTNSTGDFVFPNIPGDTYTVRITMDGFKTLERRNVAVSPGDRAVVGTLAIEVGALSETVTVAGEAPMIQAQSGERSFTVTTEAIQNLPINNRNFGAFAALTPGVVGTIRLGTQNSSTNFQLDGVSTVDSGANGQALQLNMDAIAEVRVLTSGYQAEFGRAGGLQITGVTKSGSNQFKGSLYDIRRDSGWNSNSWVNARNGDPKVFTRQQDWGYTFGGPIGKPGGKNSWFVFYAHEYRPRTTGGTINRFRVPTLLERQGDFSQTTDQNGAVFNLIRDASTGLPCTAADTRGCFQDGGVLGRIPQDRLYQLGLNVLKQWPAPNATGLNYNLQTVAPTDVRITHQPTVRVDWVPSSRLRLSAKYAGQRATVKTTPGSIPGFNDTLSRFPYITVGSGTVDYTLTPKTVIEGTYGAYQAAQQGAPPIDASTNRCSVGLCDFPLLYPDAGLVDPNSYQYKVLSASNAPMFVNGRVTIPPTFVWGSRITTPPPNLTYPAFLDLVRTNDISLSITRLAGAHTLKAGYQWDHSLKIQNLGVGTAAPFQGQVDFSNDSNNPLDAGFGFANAALGIFSSYAQQNKILEGNYIYNSHEWYLQDNWKMSNKLTMDYGLRITHQGPQYDTNQQSSNFFVDKWSLSKAPLLYQPGCSVSVSPCPSASRVAINPATGASLGTNSAVAIGTLVANTGILTNGIIQAGHGIAKENYVSPKIALAPRVGVAYDLSGSQRMVLRGSFGVFFDRLLGNSVFTQIGNPPTGLASTVQYGQLQAINTGALLQTQAAPSLTIFQYDANLPSSIQWNAGVQMALPWSSTLDVSYVGTHGYNLVGQVPNAPAPTSSLTSDLNAPDFGAAYLPQNQDPTLAASAIPGATALSTDLLRPYRGLGAINAWLGTFHNQYDSIQTSFNRRFHNGVQATLNYTVGLRTTGNTHFPLRLQHSTDGTYSVRSDQAQAEDLLANAGNRRHVVRGNFVWALPTVKGSSPAEKYLGYVVNDWQLSAVFTGGSGATYDVTYAYQTNGANVNLTGSPFYPARIKVVGDTGSGCSTDPYKQLNTASFAGPTYNSTGLESGANLLRGCFDHTVDMAVVRNIRVWGSRQAQVRIDMFNIFNTVVIDGRQAQLQLTNPIDQVVRNGEFNADGTLNTARLTPRTAGFGAATSAQAMRSIQVQLRFQF